MWLACHWQVAESFVMLASVSKGGMMSRDSASLGAAASSSAAFLPKLTACDLRRLQRLEGFRYGAVVTLSASHGPVCLLASSHCAPRGVDGAQGCRG